MKITKERLATKGWSDEEINKTIKILEKAKQKKHPHIVLLDKAVFWIALFLIVFGNFAFSTFLIPILVTFNNFSLYFIILLLSAAFGVIISIVIKDIEDLQQHHHLVLFLVVPIVGIINFLIVVNKANNNPLADALQTYHNPIIVGLVYLVGFMIPYTYLVFEEKWKR